MMLKAGTPGVPMVSSMAFHVCACVLPMPMMRNSMNSLTPVAIA
jgi:hypothetical protein